MVGSGGGPGVITLLAEPGSLEPGATVALSEEESHHIRVRRGASSTSVRVTDGRGAIATGTLTPVGKGFAAQLDRIELIPAPASIVLAVGAGDRDRFAVLVEKAAELGASSIVPLETERSAAVAGRVRQESIDRLQRRAREAVKQCGSAWAPEVEEPVPVASFVARSHEGRRLLADSAGGLVPEGLAPSEGITIAVGPEGGFTEAERTLFVAAGFAPIALGPYVLRFETAALAALAVVWQLRKRGHHG